MLSILLAIALHSVTSLEKSKSFNNSQSKRLTDEVKIPSPSEVYQTLIGMQSTYPEGLYWTDASTGTYIWKGGRGEHGEIANMGTGCVYFCFKLSDEAFGNLPARLIRTGNFKISDIKPGDLLRTDNNRHSVIVLQVYDESVVIAEGNFNKQIHWGRILTKQEVEYADHLITRYPVGYVAPEDPEATKITASGNFGANGKLHWSLNGAGYLTISGTGSCPDFQTYDERPWNNYIDKIISVRVENGVTHIGNNAFMKSSIYSLNIAGSVKSIGDNAFRECSKLTMVAIPEGTEVLGNNCFRGCISLKGVTIPSTIKEIKAGAFCYNNELATVKFLPGKTTVIMGDSMFTRDWNLKDLTLPTLIDKISQQMFFGVYLYYLYVPHGTQLLGDGAFQNSAITTLVIPSTITDFGRDTFAQTSITDIYFCGTQAQYNAIYKNNNANLMKSMKIHYVADVTNIKILNENGESIEGSTVQMNANDSHKFKIELVHSQGDIIFDPRNVEWFCVVPNTPTNDIEAIETAVDANDVVSLYREITQESSTYSVTLNIDAIKSGNARIIGHVKKNPTSSIANNNDHIYSYIDIKVPGPSDSTEKPVSKPTEEPVSKPTEEPVSKPTEEPVSKPTEEPVSKPTEEPVSKPTEEPVSKPTEEPVSKPTEEPVSKPTEEPVSKPTDEQDSNPNPTSDQQKDNQDSNGKKKKGLPIGAIAGIVAGIVVVLVAVVVGVVIYFRRKKLYEHSTSGFEPNPEDIDKDASKENNATAAADDGSKVYQENPSDPL